MYICFQSQHTIQLQRIISRCKSISVFQSQHTIQLQRIISRCKCISVFQSQHTIQLQRIISRCKCISVFQSQHTIQLQRIISRCKCQFFYANYGEVDPETGADVPLPPVCSLPVYHLLYTHTVKCLKYQTFYSFCS